MIRQAKAEDLETILIIAEQAKADMKSNNLHQWTGNYPNRQVFEDDLRQNGLFVYCKNDQIIGSISILKENDIAYQAISWKGEDAYVIHRLIVCPRYQRQGIATEMITYAKSQCHYPNQSIKIDTHPDNTRMQALLVKLGFHYRGYLSSIHRLAYEWQEFKENRG